MLWLLSKTKELEISDDDDDDVFSSAKMLNSKSEVEPKRTQVIFSKLTGN